MDGNMKRILLVLFLFSFSFCDSFAQKEEIKTVKIGKQVWMAKNLDVITFRNGDTIPQALTFDEWKDAFLNKSPIWCFYGFEIENGKKFGKLYNKYAILDPRILSPEGYHVPSNDDWNVLIDYLGGGLIAGKKMKSKNGWLNFGYGKGDNSSGFNALPGGKLFSDTFMGPLHKVIENGESGSWWSSTVLEKLFDYERRGSWLLDISHDEYQVILSWYKELNMGAYVRCLKD